MKQKKPFSTNSTYLRYFIISAIIPILASFFALSFYYNKQAHLSDQKIYNGTLTATCNAIDRGFAEIEQISFTPYLYPDLFRAMTYMKNGYYEDNLNLRAYLELAELETNYTRLFTKMLHSAKQKIISITFYPFDEMKGTAYTIYRDTAGLQTEKVPLETVESFQDATEPYGNSAIFMYHTAPLFPENDGFSLLRTIRDYDSGKALGVFRIDVSEQELYSQLSAFSLTEHSQLALIDTVGNVIFWPQQTAESTELLTLLENETSQIKYKNQSFSVQRAQISNTGWELVHLYSLRDARLAISDSIILIFIVTLLSFCVAFWLYRIQTAGTASAIDNILYAIGQLQQGNLTYICQIDDKQELSLIADALNKTGQQLDKLIRQEADSRASKSRAEFLALQSQINPHFLYNTLNGFIGLNRLGQRQLLESSIIQLTKLFRYICNNANTTTVAQEYDFAMRYLELQTLRFEDRITYNFDVEPKAAEMVIPKLVIQPIVENCIVHGLEENDKPIIITLKAYLLKNAVVLEVSDTGVGFNVNRLNGGPHVGISNVMQRLAYFHSGSDYQIESEPGKGTTVKLIIPTQEEKDAHSIG